MWMRKQAYLLSAKFQGHRKEACLAGLAIGRDEGSVGSGCRLCAVGNHALVNFKGLLRLATPIAGVDDGVVRPHLGLCSLHRHRQRLFMSVRCQENALTVLS